MAFKLSRLLPYLPLAGAVVGAANSSTSVGGFVGEAFNRLSQPFIAPGIVNSPTSSQQQTQQNLITTQGLREGQGGSASATSDIGRYVVPLAIAAAVVLLLGRSR